MKLFNSSVLSLCAVLAVLLVTFTAGKSLEAEADEGDVANSEVLSRRKRAIAETTATILAGALSAGATLAATGATALMNTGYSVTIGIEIDNYSNWILGSPIVYHNAGQVSTPPQQVHPGQREMMVAYKTGHTSTGTYGTVSWNVQGTRAFVMWSAPFSFDFHSNWLGVGVLPRGQRHTSGLFDAVYNPSGNDYYYRKAEYYNSIQTIHFCDNFYCITGTTGTSHKPQSNIKIYPMSYNDLAQKVKASISRANYQAFLTANGLNWGYSRVQRIV